MEGWNTGMMEEWKNEKKRNRLIVVSCSFNPLFHHSNIPIFLTQYSILPFFHSSSFLLGGYGKI